MKVYRHLSSLSLALAIAAFSFSHCANAATFSEGLPDAGQTLATAKIVNTSAFGISLDTITGTIGVAAGNADLYQIYLTGGNFSANTNGTNGIFAMTDTQLFLFDANGIGVFWDDDAGTNLLSQFSIANVTAGIYYLGISGYSYDPVSAGGQIFSGASGGPTGSGGASPLTSWAFSSGTTSNRGTYNIAFTGATFVPEPSEVLGLLVFASLGSGAFLKRRRFT